MSVAVSVLTGFGAGGTSYLKNFTAGRGGRGGSVDVPGGSPEGVVTLFAGSAGIVAALVTLGMVPVSLRVGAGVGLSRSVGSGLLSSA